MVFNSLTNPSMNFCTSKPSFVVLVKRLFAASTPAIVRSLLKYLWRSFRSDIQGSNCVLSVTSGKLQLDFAATNTVASLVLGGASKPAGVYSQGTDPSYLGGTGSLLVVPLMASTPTNISYSFAEGALTLTWPNTHLGWYAQSNSVNVDDPNFWFNIAGSDQATNLVITVDPAQTNVFYRLRRP